MTKRITKTKTEDQDKTDPSKVQDIIQHTKTKRHEEEREDKTRHGKDNTSRLEAAARKIATEQLSEAIIEMSQKTILRQREDEVKSKTRQDKTRYNKTREEKPRQRL